MPAAREALLRQAVSKSSAKVTASPTANAPKESPAKSNGIATAPPITV